MKRVFQLLIVVAVATCVALPASAASPKNPQLQEQSVKSSKNSKKTVTTTFRTDIDCPECEKKVMRTLPYYKGVKDVTVNIKAKTIKVKYNSSKCTDRDIIKELSKIDVRANVK